MLIDLVKTSLNITLKAESKQIENKATTNQELIQLLQRSTIELLTAMAIEEVKNEEFFTKQKSELYLLFYWYLILYHYGDRTLSIYSSEPQLQETITTLIEHTKEILKYMMGIDEFVYMLIKDNATTKYLFYLCSVILNNNS